MDKNSANLIVVAGADTGKEFIVSSSGARLGRSSSNDIVLQDPAMSRFHCRFFFKENEGLWAEDLGSANQTLLNRDPLHVSRMQPGDLLTIGDTEIRVVSDQPPPPQPHNLFETPKPAVNTEQRGGAGGGAGRRLRMTLTALIALAAAGMLLVWAAREFAAPQAAIDLPEDYVPAAAMVEIFYEKVEASPLNIFRYAMTLRDNELSVQITDLENRRHVPGNQRKKVDPEMLRILADHVRDSGFFEMQELYRGLATNVWDQWDLQVTIGSRTGRVRVLNTNGPDAFRRLRDMLDEFGRNELGLSALALTREKLLELAQAAVLHGRSLYDQRRVKHENLALAIRSLREAEWYLETIEPKPDYYQAAVALLEEAERELQEIYENHIFLADRAIRLKEWSDAAGQLRAICDKIPDRGDERHANARRRLIDVERRLKRK